MALRLGTSGALADTTIPGGQIASDTVWKLADSPYLIQGQLDVAAGVTLTIDPGVVVKFTSVAWLQVFGTLRA